MRAIDYPEFDPYDVRDAFLEFNASLMKNFNKFWVLVGLLRTKASDKPSTGTPTSP